MAAPDPEWVGALALVVGDHPVMLSADRVDVLDSLSELFGDWRSDAAGGELIEFGLSIDRRGGRGPRLIPSLLSGRSTLLKSRSLARLYRRLNVALGALVADEEVSTVGLTGFAAIVRGEDAALVPVSLAERSTDVELAVAAGGAGIAEAAATRLDLRRQQVVVAPGLVAERGILDDDIAVRPGRYQLRSVFWPEGQVAEDEPRLAAVARMAESIALGDVDDRRHALEHVVAMREYFDPRPVPRWGSDLTGVLDTLA